ncbi:MAG: thiopurine S-methyltransferase [Ignavibacteriae bacterium]|nr:thiopurine S-methyltransferase [Ignavibacteriota bacterium]MCB9217312.1 thiopurine S-methyltransferase [Ignavibacteria bacterium]
MKTDFWKAKWEENAIRFHQIRINPKLKQYFGELQLDRKEKVFVPLCGKTHDMRWLTLMGHRVIGVELSPIAVRDFFEEGGIAPVITSEPPFERWSGGGVDILLGDFFELRPEHLIGVGGLYDRASLIALPPELRARYTEHLKDILPPNQRGLLLTIEYDQEEMQGPPFSVDESEVRRLFAPDWSVEKLLAEDALEGSPMRERLTGLVEKVYVIGSP